MSDVLAMTCGGSHDSAPWLDLYDTAFSCHRGPYVVLPMHTDLPIRYVAPSYRFGHTNYYGDFGAEIASDWGRSIPSDNAVCSYYKKGTHSRADVYHVGSW
jgi:hypothetical protein